MRFYNTQHLFYCGIDLQKIAVLLRCDMLPQAYVYPASIMSCTPIEISPEEQQLERFKQRILDPARPWKISDGDYAERPYWDAYTAAFEDALGKCSTKHAPGSSSPPTTNGSAISPSPESSPRRWKPWT